MLLLAAMLPVGLYAEEEERDNNKRSSGNKQIFTGYSGGMSVHIGYLFAESPDEIYRNGSLKGENLSKDGVTLGFGGALRIHLINHIHLGAEGGVSTMPLMGSGSNIRTGWGAALCDYYWMLGKVAPMLGLSIGGGTSNRLYVPSDAETANSTGGTVYNASYTRTPFFLLNPYIGIEILLTSRTALSLKVDYMLPFGKSKDGLNLTNDVTWSNFITPSGPRLYIGFLFGKYK